MVGGCWQERRGGTASGLSCCQLNTALIDDSGPGHDEDDVMVVVIKDVKDVQDENNGHEDGAHDVQHDQDVQEKRDT